MAQQRLLVLDDDEAVGELLVFAAQRVGFEARRCEQPQLFFEAVAGWSPTHLAIDLSMPEMDGIVVMQRLAIAGCSAWVIIASGAGSAETEEALQEARRLGLNVAGVLAKPFSLASLRTLLAQTQRSIGASNGDESL
ncbi:MAG: response regulator [Ideonella sp.]